MEVFQSGLGAPSISRDGRGKNVPWFPSCGWGKRCFGWLNMGVSKSRGTPKWMVYNGKPY